MEEKNNQKSKTIDLSPEQALPNVIVEARGRLNIHGWSETAIEASSKQGQVELHQADPIGDTPGDIVASSLVDLKLRMPSDASLVIQSAYSETSIQAVHGPITIQAAYGKLALQDTGPIHIQQANGSISASQVNGDFSIERASGTVVIQGVTGTFHAESIGGNLTFSQGGSAVQATVYGSGFLEIHPSAIESQAVYQVKAYGNLVCRLPKGAQGSLQIKGYGGAVIKAGEIAKKTNGPQVLECTLGDQPGFQLNLEANGNLTVLEAGILADGDPGRVDFNLDFETPEDGTPESDPFEGKEPSVIEIGSLAADITRQVQEQLAAQMATLDLQLEQLASRLPHMSTEKQAEVMERAREKTERAREKIQRAAEKAAEKMERKMEAAQRRAERETERFTREGSRRGFNFRFNLGGFSAPRPPAPPASPGVSSRSTVSEEEKLAVLKMLAENKISAEQADSLLAALEGRE